MKTKRKDRLVDALLILLFVLVVFGSAYFIYRIMVHWHLKGLG